MYQNVHTCFLEVNSTRIGMKLPMGVGAAKLLGVRRIFARISPKLPEKRLGNFLCEQFLKQTFWDDLHRKVFMWFCKRWVPFFFKSNHVGRHFFTDITKVFRYFAQISMDFARIFRDFARFSPKLFGVVYILCTTASYTIETMVYCIRSSLPHATR